MTFTIAPLTHDEVEDYAHTHIELTIGTYAHLVDAEFARARRAELAERVAELHADLDACATLDAHPKARDPYGEVENDTLVRKADGSFNVRVYHVKHPDDSVRWLRDDGTELSPDLVARLKAEFLPKPKPEGEGKQGLENAVQPLDFKPESILALRMAGVDYIMAHV